MHTTDAIVFCRVIDNFGDAGICWRLCRQLAAEFGWRVRLCIDDPETLAPLAGFSGRSPPLTHAGVEVLRWSDSGPAIDENPDCVIEAFACRMPATLLERLARDPRKTAWFNLEYLTAEAWAADCHLRDSPHPIYPLNCRFFVPGFAQDTGGLLRERGLLARRDAWLADGNTRRAFWQTIGGEPATGSVTISLFAYADGSTETSLDAWAAAGIPATILVNSTLADQLALPSERYGGLTIRRLPFLDQDRFDRLLWSCDLNLVRGEDSFVRAQWAGRPFLWQPYRQDDAAHEKKLAAFLDRFLAGGEPTLADRLRTAFLSWSAPHSSGPPDLGSLIAGLPEWQDLTMRWCDQLASATDLASRLVHAMETRVK